MTTGTGTAPRRRTTAKQPAAEKQPAAVRLPDSTPAKFEDLMAIMDRTVDENVDVFIERAAAYRQQRRDAGERPLTAREAAQLAAATIGEEPVEELAERYQQSELKMRDEATPAEFLFAGGIATAPKFMAGVYRFIALAEMPNGEHEKHSIDGTLDEALETAANTIRFRPTKEIRARAVAALQHFSEEAGLGSGKALGVLVKMALQVVTESMGHLTTDALLESVSTSLISSDASTDGRSESAGSA